MTEHRVVVTNNGQDFRKLGRMSPEHPGLAVLLRARGRREQIELGVLLATTIEAEIRQGTPPDGRLFEIDADGLIRDYPLP